MATEPQRQATGSKVAAATALAPIAGALLAGFAALDSWAALTFAVPVLGAALVAVCELALFALALSLAPGVSRLVSRILPGTSR
jgi:hypothetical protein